jgi:hypothetical protein
MEYSKKTLKELQSLAKEKGIPKFSTYSKERLIQKLEKVEKKDVQEVKELEVPEIALPPIPETKIEVPPMPQPPQQQTVQNPFIPQFQNPGVPGGLTNPPKEVYNASINLKLDDEKKMKILKEISDFKNAERMKELQGMRDEIKELKDSFTMLSVMFMKRFGFLPLDQLPIFVNARKREQEEKNKVIL